MEAWQIEQALAVVKQAIAEGKILIKDRYGDVTPVGEIWFLTVEPPSGCAYSHQQGRLMARNADRAVVV